jgi:hypothetical protein
MAFLGDSSLGVLTHKRRARYDDPFSGLVTGTRRIGLAACMLVSGCDLG